MRTTTRATLLTLLLLLLCGCATLPPGKADPRDPWERMNRTTYKFNDKFDRAILRPLARTYVKVTPRFLLTGIRNFFDNVDYPVVMVNDLLQGQFRAFGSDTERFLLNTIFGLGGLFDPATHSGLEKNDRDLGQTFGKWGIKKGPYLVLPFFGPSDVRDAVGRGGDAFLTPRQYIRNRYWYYGLYAVFEVDVRSRLLSTTDLLDRAYDPYAFLRNAYLQRRDFKVNGGESRHEDEDEQKLLDQAVEDQDAPAAAPQSPSPSAPPSSSPPQTPPPH
jgi:phospholipid-binding lipoprotein MlaA